MKKTKHNIIPQMFDVKPKEIAGNFNVDELSEKYSTIVRLKKDKKNKKKVLRRKHLSLVVPAKWDISEIDYVKEKKSSIARQKEQLRRVSEKASTKKVFQLNYSSQKKEIPSFISIENEKFIGASKPFLNQSFNYKQELSRKRELLKRNSIESLSQKLQEWQRGRVKSQKKKRERIARREARSAVIAREKRTYFEQIEEQKKNLRQSKLAEKLKLRKDQEFQKEVKKEKREDLRLERAEKIRKFSFSISEYLNHSFNRRKQISSFVMASVAIFVCFWGVKMLSYGIQLQDDVIVKGKNAIGELAYAKDDIENQDLTGAVTKFSNAKSDFKEASSQLDYIGGDLLNVFSVIPGLSKVSSGKSIVKAGEKTMEAAEELGELALIFVEDDQNFTNNQSDINSLKDVFIESNERLLRSHKSLSEAQIELNRVNEKDIPEEYRDKFIQVKAMMPSAIGLIDDLEKNYEVLWEILGFKGVRKYLFVFQNNQEMRATGGFIGSYGVLEMNDGKVKNLFIDGIYNPDGQLRENVVPPKPIQKISAAWSTHDANWFPNFPTSAEKIAWFYEKTGGPTVDGVIAVTPTVMQKLLGITGPIDMPEYGTFVDSENFIEKTQYEVEVDYDKEENKPKKFLADLAPKVLENLFIDKDVKQLSESLRVLSESLKEKHILIYSFNYNVQKVVSEQGWSGEVLQTGKDYLMVINTNINGYKTDGVVDEEISHEAEIQSDGSIINTVKIKRKHNGGDYDYEWWNKVNSDYMRVYVPKGSQLLSVEGHTREFNSSPLDYEKLEFRRDPQVEGEEQGMRIDEETGTRIYEEENKTIFANWVYVSPKETVEIEYKYVLPFKVDLSKNEEATDSYSILVQKQSGSIRSTFSSDVKLSSDMNVFWKYPEAFLVEGSSLNFEKVLDKDIFLGVVLEKNNNL